MGGHALNLLLDTHIWIWSLISPERLSEEVQSGLEDPSNDLWLSPISVWEFLILAGKGRLSLDKEPSQWLEEALEKVPIKEAPLSFAIVLESRRVDLSHEDPADRFLAATAKILELTLVTADRRLWQNREFPVMRNQ